MKKAGPSPGLALLALPGCAGCVWVLDSLLFFAFVRKRPTDKVNTVAFHTRRPPRSIRIRRGPGVLSPETEIRRVRWAIISGVKRSLSKLVHSMSIHGFGSQQFQRIELLALVCERVVVSYLSAHSVSCRRGLGQKQRAGRRPRPMS